MKYRQLLFNPLLTLSVLIVANILSFVPTIQKPFFFIFGVLGNVVLTFCFSFFIMMTALNIDNLLNTKWFKFLGYASITVYFYLYFTWIFTVHFTFVFGFIIMPYGIIKAFQLHKKNIPKELFSC